MELERLQGSLAYQRSHLLGTLDGLPEEVLRRPVPLPSGWTPLGVVQHLAVDVERWWFRGAMVGEVSFDSFAGDLWKVDPGTTVADVLDLYRAEAAATDAIVASTPLDAVPVQWPAGMGPLPFPDLRALVLHLVAETACHAGHLDVIRELADGRQWLVLD